MPEGSAAVIPPWIQAANPAEYWMKGLAISQRQQQLDQEAQQAQAELQQKALQSKAELDISKAYHEMNYKMKQQELAEEKRKNDVAIQAAARKAAAMMEAQKRIQAGESPDKVWMELGPLSGMTGPAMAAFSREAARRMQTQEPVWKPGDPAAGIPGYVQTISPSGGWNVHFPPSSTFNPPKWSSGDVARQNDLYRNIQYNRKRLGDQPDMPKKEADSIRFEIESDLQEINDLRMRNQEEPLRSPTERGGVQMRRDPSTGKFFPNIFDPNQNQWVPLSAPPGALQAPAAAAPVAPAIMPKTLPAAMQPAPRTATAAAAPSPYAIEPLAGEPELKPTRKTRLSPFKSPDEVYKAWKAGKISRTQALEIDSKQFGLGLFTIPLEMRLGNMEWEIPGRSAQSVTSQYE